VTRWRQPWVSYDLAGRRIDVQTMDPVTAFEIEPQIIEQLGETFSLALAAPLAVLGAIGRDALADRSSPSLAATRSVMAAADRVISGLQAEAAWMLSAVERMLLGRLRIDGLEISTWAELGRAGLVPIGRWRLLGLQVSQTFGELWTRAPYDPKAPRAKDYGVPEPATPRAVAWAAALARQGYASSMVEILECWTPLRMLEAVELAACEAENHRRAQDEATQGRR
jgi:hypothetical protein